MHKHKHCKHRIRRFVKEYRHQCISGICIWLRRSCVLCGNDELVANRPYIKEPRSEDYDCSKEGLAVLPEVS